MEANKLVQIITQALREEFKYMYDLARKSLKNGEKTPKLKGHIINTFATEYAIYEMDINDVRNIAWLILECRSGKFEWLDADKKRIINYILELDNSKEYLKECQNIYKNSNAYKYCGFGHENISEKFVKDMYMHFRIKFPRNNQLKIEKISDNNYQVFTKPEYFNPFFLEKIFLFYLNKQDNKKYKIFTDAAHCRYIDPEEGFSMNIESEVDSSKLVHIMYKNK